MSNRDIKTWFKSQSPAYLMTYTGVRTNEGLDNFQTDFLFFLSLHTDFNSIPASINAFKDYQVNGIT